MNVDLEYPLAGSSVGQPSFAAGGDYSPTRVGQRPKARAKAATSTAKIKCILSGVGTADIPSTVFDVLDAGQGSPWQVTFLVPTGTYATNCKIKVLISLDMGAYAPQDEAEGITIGGMAGAPPPGGTLIPLP